MKKMKISFSGSKGGIYMYETKILLAFQNAYQAVKSGDKNKALQELNKLEQEIVQGVKIATPNERLQLLAATGDLYVELEEWELAALKYENICALAEKTDPYTTQTSGDYFVLANIREKTRDYVGAIKAMEKAIEHMKPTAEWEKYEKNYYKALYRLNDLILGSNRFF